jgi:hypothetical protein
MFSYQFAPLIKSVIKQIYGNFRIQYENFLKKFIFLSYHFIAFFVTLQSFDNDALSTEYAILAAVTKTG